LFPDLADLELVADDHGCGDDGDNADDAKPKHLDRNIESTRHENEEKYQGTCCVLVGNVPRQETDYHGEYSAEDS